MAVLLLLLLCAAGGLGKGAKRRVNVRYPVRLLTPSLGAQFNANVTRDRLVCFGNRDYSEPTYIQSLLCMLSMVPVPYGKQGQAGATPGLSSSCHGIWGSRSVIVDAVGAVEFLKVGTLPAETNFIDDHVALNVTRWLELPSMYSNQHQREIKQIPAEPIYLCARSNDWRGGGAHFSISFRPVYIRERDRNECLKKTLLHVASLLAVSSAWLLPYVAAIVVASVTYALGINKFIIVLGFSCCFVCMAPLMLTKKNRHLASLYFKYFFTRIQAEETRMVIKQRLPVFQALFFSSVVMCVGSAGSFIIYSYFGIDRDTRNTMLKVTMGISSSWFVFFLCRSFERFFRDWLWLAMSVGLAQLLDGHLNPLSRDEFMVVTILVSYLAKRSAPKILLLARRNNRVNKLLNRITTISANTTVVQLLGGAFALKKSGSADDTPAIERRLSSLDHDESYERNQLDVSGNSAAEGDDEEDEDEDEDGDADEDDDDGEEGEEDDERDAELTTAEAVTNKSIAESLSRRNSPAPERQSREDLWTMDRQAASSAESSRRRLGEELGEDLSAFALFASPVAAASTASAGGDGEHSQSEENLFSSRTPTTSLGRGQLEVLNVGHRSVALSVLGSVAIDGRRVWIPLATTEGDMNLLENLRLGLLVLGEVVSKDYPPMADYRRIVAHANFVTMHDAASFKSWTQQRGSLDVLRSLGNSTPFAGSNSNTAELVSISPRVSGRKVTFFFKFAQTAPPNKSTAGRCLQCAQRVLVAVKEQFRSVISSISIDPASVTMGPCNEFYPHVGIQSQLELSPAGIFATPASVGGASFSAKLWAAHKAYQRLVSQQQHRGRLEIPEGTRVIMGTVSAVLTAIGLSNRAAFDASSFDLDLLQSPSTSGRDGGLEDDEDDDEDQEEADDDDDDEMVADNDEAAERLANSKSPTPNFSRLSATTPASQEGTTRGGPLTLFLSMPMLFSSLSLSDATGGKDRGGLSTGSIPDMAHDEGENKRGATKCLRMLLGYNSGDDAAGYDERTINKDLTAAMCAVVGAAYVGFLQRFSESIYFKASSLAGEEEDE